MSKARRLEGPCAPLFFSAAFTFLLLLSARITTAQTVDLSALEQCAGLETQDLKLACFEAIISSSTTPETRQPEAVDNPLSDQPVAEIEVVPEAEPPVEAMRQEAPAVDAVPDSTPAVAATSTVAVVVTTEPAAVTTSTAAVAVTPEPSAAAVTTTPESLASSQLGEEHLDRSEAGKNADEDEVFHATVTEVTRGHNRILYFHFDNGQIWRQMEARHLEYPSSGEFDISITRGMMGDYRLRIGEDGRLVRIRRVQ